MNLLPLLYALLAALTGFSGEAAPVRHGQVAAASAVAVAAAATQVVSPRTRRVHLGWIDRVAGLWRERAGLSADASIVADAAVPLPMTERPARLRE